MPVPKPTVENFISLLGRSGLVEQPRLDAAIELLREQQGGELPEDSAAVAEFLIAQNLITQWQADRMLEGRFKGFFLGKYKLLSLIGTGGMSAVYLGEHTLMRSRRAIKILPQNRVEDSSYLARFYQEAEAAGALEHTNIVRAYDVGNDGKTHYLIMEYVKGDDLQDLVDQQGPLPYPIAADYIRQAAEGLGYAHEKGMVHRDIKPANLLLDSGGTVKLLDMGLALLNRDDKVSLTIQHDENVLGTADYLPPEQAINSHTVDQRADIYSLGGTLYFLLTGHPPFPEGTLAQRLHMHQTQEPASILKDRPDAPVGLIEICQKMMAKRADDRFQSAQEVSEALTRWMENPNSRMITGRFAQALGGRNAIVSPSSPRGGSGSGTRPSSDLAPGEHAPGDTVAGSGRSTLKGPSSKQPLGAPTPSTTDEETIELADIPDAEDRRKPNSKTAAPGAKPPSAKQSPSGVRKAAPGSPPSARPPSDKTKPTAPPVELTTAPIQTEKLLNELEQFSKAVESPTPTHAPVIKRTVVKPQRDWRMPLILGAIGTVLFVIIVVVSSLIWQYWEFVGKSTHDL